jgi:hypothetical protein
MTNDRPNCDRTTLHFGASLAGGIGAVRRGAAADWKVPDLPGWLGVDDTESGA